MRHRAKRCVEVHLRVKGERVRTWAARITFGKDEGGRSLAWERMLLAMIYERE